MYSFLNDYSECAHPYVLEYLNRYAKESFVGYGEDEHTKRAEEKCKQLIQCPDASVSFISGGTLTNLLTISSFLKPYQAVIAADTGHINVHETGAIETTGHKVLAMPTKNGKLTPSLIKQAVVAHEDYHMVMPAMVYISNSTELGTIYTKEELIHLSDICKRLNLLLYLDGARLGSALTCQENDLTLPDIASYTDAFYLGGTKNGALFGEALILVKKELQRDFQYAIKNRGAMLAKGFVTGLQFEALLEDNLYFTLASHANQMASKIRMALKKAGFPFFVDSPTNQLFPILPNELCHRLEEQFVFSVWNKPDKDHTTIRLVTSFATTEQAVDTLLSFFK